MIVFGCQRISRLQYAHPAAMTIASTPTTMAQTRKFLIVGLQASYFMVGMTKALSSTAPSGQRAVIVLTLV